MCSHIHSLACYVCLLVLLVCNAFLYVLYICQYWLYWLLFTSQNVSNPFFKWHVQCYFVNCSPFLVCLTLLFILLLLVIFFANSELQG